MDRTMSIEQLKEVISTYGTGADYMDNSEGMIYHISSYFHDKKMGLPVEGMPVTFSDGEKGIIPDQYLSELNIFFEEDKKVEPTKSEFEKFWNQVINPVFTESGFFHTSASNNTGSVEIEMSKDKKEVSFWLHFYNKEQYDNFYDTNIKGNVLEEYEELGKEEAYNYVDSGKGSTYNMYFELIPIGWAADMAGTFLK